MGKIVFFFFFLSWTAMAHAQTETTISSTENKSKPSFGLNLSYFTPPDLYFNNGFAFPTQLSLNTPKYTLLLGPVWWIDKNSDVSVFRGGMISGRYFSHKLGKRLNFYFLYDLVYLYENTEWATQMHFYPQLPVNQTYDATLTTKWRSVSNQFGYGFRINIYEGFYINQSFSIGIEFYSYQSETDIIEDPSLSSEHASGGNGTSSFLKIGFGYDFK